ncbi:hypotheticall protein [Emericellopsis cladophorae]|uniref:Hypotheticall protein n=1 Tax=Emericellopsis cladophorae TaxID=2686198 RepID=A0A9Q0BAE3_9HYPO|nr:hypotheticall protein [Emericellopsis cladophorae]KAI6778267.1 hypotheticall protein [Emericellopsis cladophorae]
MDPQTLRDATAVYNYHRMSTTPPHPADAIFCLCSLDTRVATRASELYLAGLAPLLIFSGGSGKLTAERFDEPEAKVFAMIARNMGVPSGAILVEPASTNTGENVRFTFDLLSRRQIDVKSFILVQKPYMERRTFATFKKQWPGPDVEFSVTSPQYDFAEYCDDQNPQDLIINIMVGDLIRIREYPRKGFQMEQGIPDEVWDAGQRLIAAGFDGHLP